MQGRIGGFILTDKAVELGAFKKGMQVLDIGCGPGITIEYLRQKFQIDATGIDNDKNLLKEGSNCISAVAEEIPFSDGTFDGILMECSFSLFDDQYRVLKECHRILKPGGSIIISDLYARGEPIRLEGILGRIDTKEKILTFLNQNRFYTEFFEDCSYHLKSIWGQIIMDHGSHEFYQSMEVDPEIFKKARCGYYILKAVKKDE